MRWVLQRRTRASQVRDESRKSKMGRFGLQKEASVLHRLIVAKQNRTTGSERHQAVEPEGTEPDSRRDHCESKKRTSGLRLCTKRSRKSGDEPKSRSSSSDLASSPSAGACWSFSSCRKSRKKKHEYHGATSNEGFDYSQLDADRCPDPSSMLSANEMNTKSERVQRDRAERKATTDHVPKAATHSASASRAEGSPEQPPSSLQVRTTSNERSLALPRSIFER